MSAESGNKDTELTELLLSWGRGDDLAQQKLVPLVYEELRKVAHRYMRWERPGHTLQTTALVHETYLRLLESRRVRWRNRSHFMAVSAQLMRRILVDFARSKRAVKRGGDLPRVTLDEGLHQAAAPGSRLRSPGRRAHRAFGLRCPQGSRGRASLLRRPELRGDRSRSGGVRRYRSARLEDCQGLLTPNRW